jgi:hypothetical protein
MQNNPYESPQTSSELMLTIPFWKQGWIGFSLALVAVSAAIVVGMFGPTVAIVLGLTAFLAVPSLFISIVERVFVKSRLSTWGIAISLFVWLYLPTFSIGLRHALTK